MEDSNLIPSLTAIIALVNAIVALIQALKLRSLQRIIRNLWFWIVLLLFLIFTIVTIWLYMMRCTDTSRYGFEEGKMGWIPQTDGDSQGVISTLQSDEQAKVCKRSLKLNVDLEGSHPNRSKGEVFVEIPVQNLVGKPISVWVYIPNDAVGPIANPNGIQVFVKDTEDRAEYGTWWEITPTLVDSWQEVTLTPSSSPPLNGSMEDGFDPTQIKIVGVKIAIGERSADEYEGFIYIDGFDWP